MKTIKIPKIGNVYICFIGCGSEYDKSVTVCIDMLFVTRGKDIMKIHLPLIGEVHVAFKSRKTIELERLIRAFEKDSAVNFTKTAPGFTYTSGIMSGIAQAISVRSGVMGGFAAGISAAQQHGQYNGILQNALAQQANSSQQLGIAQIRGKLDIGIGTLDQNISGDKCNDKRTKTKETT